MSTLPFLLLLLFPFVIFDSDNPLILCPLCKSETLWNIFMILGRNVKRDQMTCRVQEWLPCLSYFWSYLPLLCLTVIIPWYCVRSVSQRPFGIFLSHLLVAGCDIGVRFSVRPSAQPPARPSTFMSTFDIYVKVSILINYKTKQPSNLAWNISLTSRLCDTGAHFSIRLSVRLSVCPSLNSCYVEVVIYVKVSNLINYKTKQP